MRKRSHRHPVLEALVFAAALFLALFVGRQLWLRRDGLAPKPPEPTRAEPIILTPERPPLPVAPGAGRTETAVSAAPAIKLTRVQRRPRKAEPVPVPR